MGNNKVFAVTGIVHLLFGIHNYLLNIQSVFFICFRECLETTVVVSVLLAFLKQSLYESDRPTYKRLVKQVSDRLLHSYAISSAKTNRSGWDAP